MILATQTLGNGGTLCLICFRIEWRSQIQTEQRIDAVVEFDSAKRDVI